MTANATVSLIIRLKDAVSAPARGVKNAFKQIGSDFAKLRSGFDLAGKVSFAATAVNQLGAQARGALTSVLGPAMQFEEAIARAGALTSNITDKEMADLTAAARQMGRETRYTATEAAEGLGQLAIAGFNAREQIGSLPAVLKLTQASGVDMGRTADILSDLVGAFGKSAKDSGDVAGLLAATFSTSTTTLETLYETMKVGASVTTQFGISMQDTALATGLLGNKGLKGTQASTALVNALTALNSASKKGSKALRSMGLTADEVSTGIEHPIELLNKLNKAFEQRGFSKPERMNELAKIFGRRGSGLAGVSILMDAMNEVSDTGENAFERLSAAIGGGQTKLNQIARVMDSTALAGVRKFQSAVESLKIDIATQLGPSLTPLIKQVTELVGQFAGWARQNPELVATVGKVLIGVAAFSAVFGPLLLALSALISSITLLGGAVATLKMPFRLLQGQLAACTTKGSALNKTFTGPNGLSAAVGVVGAAFAGWEVGKYLDEALAKALGLKEELASIHAGIEAGKSDTFNEFVRGAGIVTGIDTLKEIAEGNIQANKNLKEGMTSRVNKIGMAGGNYTMRGESNLVYDPKADAERWRKEKARLEIAVTDERVRVRKVEKKGGFWDSTAWKIDTGGNF